MTAVNHPRRGSPLQVQTDAQSRNCGVRGQRRAILPAPTMSPWTSRPPNSGCYARRIARSANLAWLVASESKGGGGAWNKSVRRS